MASSSVNGSQSSPAAKKVDPLSGKSLVSVKVRVGNPAIELVDCTLFVYRSPDPPQNDDDDADADADAEADVDLNAAATRAKADIKSNSAAAATAPAAVPTPASISNDSVQHKSDDPSTAGDVKLHTAQQQTPPRDRSTANSELEGATPTSAATNTAVTISRSVAIADDFKSGSGLVYVYDIPSHVSLADFYAFVGAAADSLIHVQITSTVYGSGSSLSIGARNTYTVLCQFRSVDAAYAFRRHYDGRAFNSMEAHTCKVDHLHSVEFADKQKQLSFPPRDVSRDCTVCLDPIVPSKAAQITILCAHVFHFHCLSKWADSSCPLCRYMMQPAVTSQCDVCRTTESLWICLICGHVGCGRYGGRHAVRHFEETGHTFSLDVTQQKVWDYVSDGYVHRLVLNKKDGQLVEVGGAAAAAAGGGGGGGGGGNAASNEGPGRASAFGSALASTAGGTPMRMAGSSSLYMSGSLGESRNTTALGGGGGGGSGPLNPSAAAAAAAAATSINPFEHYASLKLEQILVEYNYLLSSQLEKQRSYFQSQLRSLESERSEQTRSTQLALSSAAERHTAVTKRLQTGTKRIAESKTRLTALNAQLTNAVTQTDRLKQLNATLTAQQAAKRSTIHALDSKLQSEKEEALKSKDALIHQLEEELNDLTQHVHVSARIPKSLRQQIADGSAVVVSNEATFAAAGAGGVDPNDHTAKAKLKRLKEKNKRRS